PSSAKQLVVIGGGIVGLSCALYAQRAGHRVTIIDPRGFGGGASYGNAGVIATSEVVPIATPELLRSLPRLLFASNSPLTLRWSYAHKMLGWFYRFIRSAKPDQMGRTMDSLAALLSRATAAHQDLARLSNCEGLIRSSGWIKAFDSDTAFQS